ncbi:hypothetical protein IC619_002495 [Hazenella sp. IB182353]|uniref:hypothetical protein n=1 Tax=Polycladospora coralii TaxID=2771432 RepID=UPI0017467E98|nr:hypothetical protein [Polycladospora coralii]MBS7529365.1 hypothetical protein [Polycladospora coralii]
MSDRYIHTREIEEYLYCHKRWKQNPKYDHYVEEDFEIAIHARNHIKEFCNPIYPKKPTENDVTYPKIPENNHAFLSRVIVVIIFFYMLIKLDIINLIFIILGIICVGLAPHMVSKAKMNLYHSQVRKVNQQLNQMQANYQNEVDWILQKSNQGKNDFIVETRKEKKILLSEIHTNINKQINSNEQIVRIFDDEMKLSLKEDYKTLWVILDRSNEDKPPYVPIGHQYHTIRLAAQMAIAEDYFGEEYKIRGYVKYKNVKPHVYWLDAKSRNRINRVIQQIDRREKWNQDNTYRCVYCPLLHHCIHAKKEALDYIATKKG